VTVDPLAYPWNLALAFLRPSLAVKKDLSCPFDLKADILALLT